MHRCFALLKSIKNNGGGNWGSNKSGSNFVKNTAMLSSLSSAMKAKSTSLAKSNTSNTTECANVSNNITAVDSNISNNNSRFASLGSVANANGCEALVRRVYLPWEARPAEYSYTAQESDWFHLNTLLNCLISNAEKVIESYGKHSGHMLLNKLNRPIRQTRQYTCIKIRETIKARRQTTQSRTTKKICDDKDSRRKVKSKPNSSFTKAKTNESNRMKGSTNGQNMYRGTRSKETKPDNKTGLSNNHCKNKNSICNNNHTLFSGRRTPKLRLKVISTPLCSKEKKRQIEEHATKTFASNAKRGVQLQQNKSKTTTSSPTKRSSSSKHNCTKYRLLRETKK